MFRWAKSTALNMELRCLNLAQQLDEPSLIAKAEQLAGKARASYAKLGERHIDLGDYAQRRLLNDRLRFVAFQQLLQPGA
jgi:hypothetical protein